MGKVRDQCLAQEYQTKEFWKNATVDQVDSLLKKVDVNQKLVRF